MRYLFCCLLLGLSAASLIAQTAAPSVSPTPHPPLSWQQVRNTIGDFTITLPANYKTVVHTFPFQREPGSSVVYEDWRTIRSYWDDSVMVVEFNRVNQPQDAVSQLAKGTAFNGGEGKRREVINNGVKGREIVETKNGYTWRRQYFPLKGMVVMVMTITGKPENTVISYFWDSLRVGQEAAKQISATKAPLLDWPASAQADNTTSKTGKEVTRKAVILSRPEPPYPNARRNNSRNATVSLRVLLGADGQIQKIEPIRKMSDAFDAMAVVVAHRIIFIPAQFEGRNVSQWVQIEYSFSIY